MKSTTSKPAPKRTKATPKTRRTRVKSPHLPLSATQPGVWFAPVRWSYLPVAWQGWILYLPYIAYLMIAYIVVDRHNTVIADKVIGVVPFWVAGAAIMQWIASHKSG